MQYEWIIPLLSAYWSSVETDILITSIHSAHRFVVHGNDIWALNLDPLLFFSNKAGRRIQRFCASASGNRRYHFVVFPTNKLNSGGAVESEIQSWKLIILEPWSGDNNQEKSFIQLHLHLFSRHCIVTYYNYRESYDPRGCFVSLDVSIGKLGTLLIRTVPVAVTFKSSFRDSNSWMEEK